MEDKKTITIAIALSLAMVFMFIGVIIYARVKNGGDGSDKASRNAAEEMVDNIVSIGYKKEGRNYIDVSLKINKDSLLLRIRDDGVPFDPTKYEFDNDENYSTSGIQLISKLVNKMSYLRVLSLNNTVFEISLGGKTDGN